MIHFFLPLSVLSVPDEDLREALNKCGQLTSEAEQLTCFRGLVSEQTPSTSESPKTPAELDLKVSQYGFRSVKITSGVFMMGSPETDPNHRNNETLHQVSLTRDFWVMEKEVGQSLWERIMGTSPSVFGQCGSDCPVENISWTDAVRFANALSKREGLERCYVIKGSKVMWPKGVQCTGWRLPTEAEWEYAARGGSVFSFSGSARADEAGWIDRNANGQTHPSCLKTKNQFGLCDMSGNVWEWVWDGFSEYSIDSISDPIGPQNALYRVLRGGCWDQSDRYSRVSFREGNHPSVQLSMIGVRLVRTAR